ncbi:MAG: Hpt domain-containing protein [Deltaproteobacteria bacterium]|jgi:signal transduction histidine kinase/CheY-like chemotaxis protein/HPt (histidine-containing phosphotransfer) domain-containing protein|nr:Hpt domain-containing protein [Deltaproteobacteria bacterium]
MFQIKSILAVIYFILALSLAPAAALLGLSIMDSRERLLSGMEKNLARHIDQLALRQEAVLQNIRAFTASLRAVSGAGEADRAFFGAIFAGLFPENGIYDNAFISNAEGTVFASARNFRPGVNIGASGIFKAAGTSRAFSWAGLGVDPFTGSMVLPLAEPILDEEGRMLALIVVSVKKFFLSHLIRGMPLLPGATLTALDENGAVVDMYPPVELDDPEDWSALRLVIQEQWEKIGAAEAEQGFLDSLDMEGETVLGVYRRVAIPGRESPFLTLFLDLPASMFQYEANHLLMRGLLLALLSMFTALAEIWLLGRLGFLRPVNTLMLMVRRLSAGRPWHRAASGLTGDFMLLLSSVDSMAASLEKRSQDLIAARHEAFAANRIKNEFLANMSHGVRGPMNAIISMAYLILKMDLGPKEKAYLEKIYGAANSLLGIINDILDFSRMESGQFNLEKVPFFINEVLENTVGLLRAKVGEKNVRLTFSVSPEVPAVMLGDPLRLGQVLVKLIDNAIKFTEEGDIQVTCSLLGKDRDKALLSLQVRDTGIGMNSEQLGRLFQPFTQADGSATRKFGGTGLGLIICKRLVEFMDGSINLSSSPGRGTTAEARVSLGVPSDDDLEIKRLSIRFIGLPVLLIDEGREAGQILEAQLRALGLLTDCARTPREGFDLLVRRDRISPYRLVFVDINMLGLDGLELTRHILRELDLEHEPPVMLTSSSSFSRELEKKCKDAGAVALVRKPLAKDRLAEVLTEFFQERPEPEFRPERASAGGADARYASKGKVEAEGEESGNMDKSDIGDKAMPVQIPSGAQADLPPLPGLNPEALKRLGNNRKIYRKLLVQFVEFYRDIASVYRKAVEAENLEEATRIAHTLKGLAGSIGAEELFEAARRLEMAHKESGLPQPALAGDCFGRLAQVQDMLSLALGLEREEAALPPSSAASSPASEEEKAGARLALDKLVAYLQDDDGEAAAFFEEKRALLALLFDEAVLDRLQSSLAHFEFEEALEILGKTHKS